MTVYPLLKLRCEFQIVELGKKVTAVSVRDCENEYHGVIKLNNDPARFMFEKLQEGITLPELIEACMEKFDSPVEDVGPKVIEFLEKLREQNLLVADKTRGVRLDDGQK